MILNGKEITINRNNAVISETDEQYCKLVEKILNEGLITNNRTGIDTISIAGANMCFNLENGFPIAETKKVKANNFTSEIQWIHQVQSNNVNWLKERENNTWNLWSIDDDGIYRIYEQGDNAIDDPEREVPLVKKAYNEIGVIIDVPVLDEFNRPIMVKSKDVMDKKTNPRTIKQAYWFGKEYKDTIGEAYGYLNSLYKRPQCVEWTLKNNPTDRRINISLWQDAHIPKAVLPSCVWSSEYKVSPDGKLHAYIHQRSADVPLGLPFNISQYAILLSMFAKTAGLTPGTMSWSIMDAHIYVNQLEGIKKQLNRYKYMEEYSNIIQTNTDEDIETLYNSINELLNQLERKAHDYLSDEDFNLPMSKRIEKLKNTEFKYTDTYLETFERKTCFDHLLTRETPELELSSHDSIFDYSTDYVSSKDPYMKENPIGNKEIVLKKYHPTPFISMPIAQ